MAIGERIEKRLADLKWSQSTLARATGLPQTTINSLIRRGARMTPHLGKIATALGTSSEYLLGKTDDPEEYPSLMPSLPADHSDLLVNFRSMRSPDRSALFQLARSLATPPEMVLPDEHALAQMFEALLMRIDQSQPLAAQARLLAQRLPIGLSQLRDLQPHNATIVEGAEEAEAAAGHSMREAARQ